MSEYTDLKNNTYKISQSSIANSSENEKHREEIIEELYRIFDKK